GRAVVQAQGDTGGASVDPGLGSGATETRGVSRGHPQPVACWRWRHCPASVPDRTADHRLTRHVLGELGAPGLAMRPRPGLGGPVLERSPDPGGTEPSWREHSVYPLATL